MKKTISVFTVFICLVASNRIAHANPVSYSAAFGDALAGTRFTYISQSGFLSFSPAVLQPNFATDVFLNGYDAGLLTGFKFQDENTIAIFSAGYNQSFQVSTYYLSAYSFQRIYTLSTELVDLTILPGDVLNTTPEPSSITLVGPTLLGLAAFARRRFARGRRS